MPAWIHVPSLSRFRAVLFLVLLSGCAGAGYRYPGPLDSLGKAPPSSSSAREAAATAGNRQGARVARVALKYLDAPGTWPGREDRDDCSGFVEAVYRKVGLDLEGSSADLLERGKELGLYHFQAVATPGDMVFFENTYDRNGNGKVDDGITHVGIVVGVAPDGTLSVVHRGGEGISSLRMNLRHKGEPGTDAGVVWNDNIRAPNRKDPPGTLYGAGELCVGFVSFWRAPADRS